jgi:hypothetical protein
VTILLDANVLIALLVNDHVHHSSAETWFLGVTDGFATCPITQGSLIRLSGAVWPPTNGTSSGPTTSRTPMSRPPESSATVRSPMRTSLSWRAAAPPASPRSTRPSRRPTLT